MNIQKEQLRLYAVTDSRWLGKNTLYDQVEKGIAVADVTHYESEVLIVPVLQKKLTEAAQKNGWDMEVVCSKVDGQTFWHV